MEQTTPETKRTDYEVSELVGRFSSYTIYRYNKRDGVTAPPYVPVPVPPDAECFPKCDSDYKSLTDALDSLGIDSSKAYRKRIAEVNGISDYSYTSEQNTYMLNLLKEGKLINPDGNSVEPPAYLQGDVNNDGEFNISDAVLLQKWLLGISNDGIVNWKSADLYEDDRLDAFDMIEMRKLLINSAFM